MRYDHIVLPEVIRSMLAEDADVEEATQSMRLKAIGKFFKDQLDEDVKHKHESGIEGVWLYCEEAYAGIDDANRHEFSGGKWTKPMTSEGPVSTEKADRVEGGEPRSNAFVMLTARYVDAAAAKVSDIMLPQDDKPFTFGPTPVPDLIKAAEDNRQIVHHGVPLQRDATPDEAVALSGQPQPPMNELSPTAEPQPPIPAQPGQGPAMPLTPADLSEERTKDATKAAEKAQTIIYDWLVEAKFTREMRACNHDAARLGVCVLKGPFPKVQKSMAAVKEIDADGKPFWNVKSLKKIVPTYERKDPWNIFPAKDCGEHIHNGDHLFERDLFSSAQLRALKGDPGYLPDQIEAAIKEGPDKKHLEGRNPAIDESDERFEIWYRYGSISREDMELIEQCAPEVPGRKRRRYRKDQDEVFAILTMVNDRVIRAVLNPSRTGKMPYHVKPWRRRAGHWAGIGVAEQVSLPQRACNGGVRALLDNAGLSSGIQLIYDSEAIEPVDGNVYLSRNKIWRKKIGGMQDDMRKAMTVFQIPSLQVQLQAVIDSFYRMAEDSTSIPLISQGQSGATAPETLGATQLQDNNANQLLRDQAHDFDQLIKLPMIEQSYEYLLLDPDVSNDAKGDFKIHISSAVAMVEQALQDQFILQLFPSVTSAANPWRVNPAKLFAKLAKAKRMNPVEVQYSDDEWKRIESQPPPKDKSVQVAEVKAQADLQRAKMDTDRDAVYVQAETQRTHAEHEVRMKELEMKLQLAQLDYANKHQISLDQLKTELATTTMKLQVQKELAAHDRPGETMNPPTEPAGRAPAGQSFEK